MSVGVAISDCRRTTSIEELTSQADALMYIEKRAKHPVPNTPSSGLYQAPVQPPLLKSIEYKPAPQQSMASVS
jgi:hypothetical protein